MMMKLMRNPAIAVICLTIYLALAAAVPSAEAAPDPDISKLKPDSAQAFSEADLVRKADLIVYGWLDSGQHESVTGEKIDGRQVINYVQTIHVKKLMKGSSGALVELLTAGLFPLPEPSDPLTKRFTGPLAEGNYVCFLKSVPDTKLYTLVGLWQGVYPVHQEKTMALEESGFSAFDKLSPAQMEAKIKSYGLR